ncbi:hypothetical protein [Candidatus Poriferisodalis sp.]
MKLIPTLENTFRTSPPHSGADPLIAVSSAGSGHTVIGSSEKLWYRSKV